MSGGDTSTPADRVAFTSILDGGADPGGRLPGLCVTLANCQIPVPDQIWVLLNYANGPQTFAVCAARVAAYRASGRVLGT